jgi:hypothetical protein
VDVEMITVDSETTEVDVEMTTADSETTEVDVEMTTVDSETTEVDVEMATKEEATIVAEVATAGSTEDDPRTGETVGALKTDALPMFSPAEPRGSVRVMHTINHHEISGRHGSLSAEMTEWT